MVKHLSTALALSAVLTVGALASDFSETDANKESAAVFFRTVEADTAQEESRWWDDFRHSKKNIVEYVADISASDPKAAMWFLLTGGKYGFADRQATDAERDLLMLAMRNVAIAVYQSSQTAGAEMWKDLTEKYNQGHAHVQFLNREVNDLRARVSQLEANNLRLTETNRVLTTRVRFLESGAGQFARLQGVTRPALAEEKRADERPFYSIVEEFEDYRAKRDAADKWFFDALETENVESEQYREFLTTIRNRHTVYIAILERMMMEKIRAKKFRDTITQRVKHVLSENTKN